MRSGWQGFYSVLFIGAETSLPEPTVELFNMMIDPKEQHNLSAEYPDKTETMKAEIERWWTEVTAGTRLEGSSFLEFEFR